MAALVIVCAFVAVLVVIEVHTASKPSPRCGKQLRKAKALQAAQEILDG